MKGWGRQRGEWVCVEWSHVCEPSLFSKEAELQILDHRQKAGTQGPQAAERRKQQAARCPWGRLSYLLFPRYMPYSVGTPQLARGAGSPRPCAQPFECFLPSPVSWITASGSQKSQHLSLFLLCLREARYTLTSGDAHSRILTLRWPPPALPPPEL